MCGGGDVTDGGLTGASGEEDMIDASFELRRTEVLQEKRRRKV